MAQKTQELFWWRLSHILIKTYVCFKWNNDRCWSWTLWRLKFLLPKLFREKPDTASLRKHRYSNRSIWVNNGSRIRRCPVFKVVGNRRHSSKNSLKFLEIIGWNIIRHRCYVTWSILFLTARLSGVLKWQKMLSYRAATDIPFRCAMMILGKSHWPISRLKWYASRFRKGILRKWVWLCLIWVCELFWFAQIHLVLREA